MSSITAFRKAIESNYKLASELTTSKFIRRGITVRDIDQYTDGVNFPVLHAKTLEMAYDSFKILRTFVISGEEKYNTSKIAKAFSTCLSLDKINNTSPLRDIDEVFQAKYITYLVSTALAQVCPSKT